MKSHQLEPGSSRPPGLGRTDHGVPAELYILPLKLPGPSRTAQVEQPLLGRTKKKAGFFAEKLGITGFKQSCGWLDRFKECHGISFKKICGESKAVDMSSQSVEDWNRLLTAILKKYHARDVYNADETGVFYKMQPDKTMGYKHVDWHGGKRSKERLSVLVCANMDASDKLPLLVIGKAAKPRCF